MQFNDEDKRQILKAFTSVLKDANGKGPKNIYVKYLEDELHIVMQGVVSDFEKYLIGNFGQEAIDVFRDFYERDSHNAEARFLRALDYKYPFKFKALESDFENDIFVYRMAYASCIK